MWLRICTVPSIVPHRSSIHNRPMTPPAPMIPPIHLGISLFLSKWRPRRRTRQTSVALSCQHHDHVTALGDLVYSAMTLSEEDVVSAPVTGKWLGVWNTGVCCEESH